MELPVKGVFVQQFAGSNINQTKQRSALVSLGEGNPPAVTDGISAQRGGNAEMFSI